MIKKGLVHLGSVLAIVGFPSSDVLAQDETIEEIAVTGTRIRGANPDSFSPVSIINQEQIQISGKISIGELLQEMPSQGSGLNRNYNNGGDGSVRMDFRNLGAVSYTHLRAHET